MEGWSRRWPQIPCVIARVQRDDGTWIEHGRSHASGHAHPRQRWLESDHDMPRPSDQLSLPAEQVRANTMPPKPGISFRHRSTGRRTHLVEYDPDDPAPE